MSNRKNSDHFTFDFVGRKIVGTKTSLNKAKHYGSDEYYELREMMEAYPRFRVVTKEIKQRASKQTYKNLNFDFIEKYISTQPHTDEIKREYEQVRLAAVSLGKSEYPYTKSWFLKKFGTADKPFDMEQAEQLIAEKLINAGLAAAQTEAAA